MERRKHERIQVDRSVHIATASGMEVTARMIDISAGGAGILHSAPGDVDAVLQLSFTLHFVPGETYPMQMAARVRHNRLRSDGYVIGVEFMDATPEQVARIRRFVVDTRSLRLS